MRLLIPLLLIGCASVPEPITLLPPEQAVEVQRVIDIKNDTLWMYSTGSFALLCLGLAFIAFLKNKFAGAVFIAGGAVGMAAVWVFESEWFPWIAGGTVSLIVLNALAFAWVKIYRAHISSDSSQPEQTKCKEDDYPPLI
jgi:hypothetical protein